MKRLALFFRLLLRKGASFFHLSLWMQLWFLPTWILLGIAKMVIFTMTFRRLAERLGIATGVDPWVPLLSPLQESRALRIGRVVRLAARYTPWDSNCFPQAVVARLLLGLYGVPYALFFGLSRAQDGSGFVAAHAWVVAGRVRVTGGYSFGEYTVVGTYVAPCLLVRG